jgi:hypothetical protein
MSEFIASPTMEGFMLSDKYVRVLAGPIGGGKSVACAHELMRWASLQQPNSRKERKTRFLIVRNTADQLRSTTRKTVFDWFPPGEAGTWVAQDKTLYIDAALEDGTIMKSEWMFIALDTPDDVRKALSLEATGLWGNECRELHPEVVDGLLMRVNRYPSAKDGGCTRAGAIFDTNMPAEDTWWQEKMDNPPRNWSIHIQPEAAMPKTTYIAKYDEEPDENMVALDNEQEEWVIDHRCDNFAYLSPNNPGQYYRETIEGKTKDFIRVYLQCRFGRSLNGFPVYEKTFLPEVHIAEAPLRHINAPSYPLTIGLDFGRTPAATIGQLDTQGRLNILSEITSENMGIERFVDTLLKPHLATKYPGMPVRIAPDPAGWQKTQVGEVSPVDVLKQRGFQVIKPATNKPSQRIEAVERWLTRFVDGKPAFRVDPSCSKLIQGFKSAYRWKMNRKGELEDQTPEKNDASHIHDSAQYLALVMDTSSGYSVQTQRREVKAPPVRWGAR